MDYDDPPEYEGELRLTLAEHLDELRQRIFRMLLVYVVGCAAGWLLSEPVFDLIEGMAAQAIPQGTEFLPVFSSISNAFFLKIRMAMMLGLALTFPFLILQVWGFVAPGLHPKERKPFRVIGPVSFVLFFVGCALCWSMLPAAFQWFASFLADFPNAALFQEPGTMVFLVVKLMLAFGIGFQLPLVVFFLARVEIITPEAMLRSWRQVIVGIFVFGAVLTPTGDFMTLAVLGVPLVALFFGSVWAAQISRRRAQKRAAVEAK